jgi:hypothetical protein
MTGFDGQSNTLILTSSLTNKLNNRSVDYLQYTITSRKEMPNAEFVKEIAKAAEELYSLHVATQVPKAQL